VLPSADILLWEARIKKIEEIDYEQALYAMRKNAECEPPDPYLNGRYLREYRDFGYLSTNVPSSVSKTIKYSYQDWCIAGLAASLGHKHVAEHFYEESRKLWNLWRDDKKAFCPRNPDKSSLRVRSVLYNKYSATRTGLPDNEDMGSHSTYVICSSMGLYPIYGQDLYLISAPVFEETQIALENGQTLTIAAPGASKEKHFVAAARLNGTELNRSYLRHSEISAGGILELTVSEQSGAWAHQTIPPASLFGINQ
jgi:putative alpha-1,2-mannosidase